MLVQLSLTSMPSVISIAPLVLKGHLFLWTRRKVNSAIFAMSHSVEQRSPGPGEKGHDIKSKNFFLKRHYWQLYIPTYKESYRSTALPTHARGFNSPNGKWPQYHKYSAHARNLFTIFHVVRFNSMDFVCMSSSMVVCSVPYSCNSPCLYRRQCLRGIILIITHVPSACIQTHARHMLESYMQTCQIFISWIMWRQVNKN